MPGMFFEAMAVDDNLRWCTALDAFVTIHKPASSSQSWVRQGPALIQVDNASLCMGKDLVEAAARAAQYNESERMHLEDDLSLLAADCLAPDIYEPDVDQPDVDQPDVDQPDVDQPDINQSDDEVVYLMTKPADDVQYIKTVKASNYVQNVKTVRPRRAVRLETAMMLRSQKRPRRSKRLWQDV